MEISWLSLWNSMTHLLPSSTGPLGSIFLAAPPNLGFGFAAAFLGCSLTTPPARSPGFLCVCMSRVTFLSPLVTLPPWLSCAKSALVSAGALLGFEEAALSDSAEGGGGGPGGGGPPAAGAAAGAAATALTSLPFLFHVRPVVWYCLMYFCTSWKNSLSWLHQSTCCCSLPLYNFKILFDQNRLASRDSLVNGAGVGSTTTQLK
mmetsp:Transcript_33264/g.93261  ORF Transcript_33264/g.93261 Transcript_33264/m.93261 type:complete len:204 (-) Transcript_33264:543-1154(-)